MTRPLPPAEKALATLAAQLDKSPHPKTAAKIEAVTTVRHELRETNPKDMRMLSGALRGVAKRFRKLADRLEQSE